MTRTRIEHLQTIRTFFPQALTTDDTVDTLLDTIKREFGLAPSQIMHADSMCSDDLNNIEYPPRAYEMLGPFKMGGLNGFPFTGLTGMGAFAHHVPVDGAVLVFHAPHIGVSKAGEIGQILRPGQTTCSTCCGAAQAALGKLQRGELKAGHVEELDYQQHTLEQILLRSSERVLSAKTPILEATNVIYEAIEERIDLLASRTKYPCKHLFLMGGVFINGDHDVGSFCDTRRAVHVDLETGARRDLLGFFRNRRSA